MKSLSTIVACLILLASQHINAQDNSDSYNNAIGVKLYPGAITYKTSNDGRKYFEGQAAFFKKGFRATVLYEIHNEISALDGLRWYYGTGPHLGFYRSKYYNGSTMIGIDAVLGLDYKLPGTPLNFSLDWQPSFEFGDGSGFDGWGGLAVRFAF